MLERRRELGRRHAHVLLEPEDETRVDRTRARRHHEALQRREAHRRVDGASARDGRERRPGAEVAGNDSEAFGGTTAEVGSALRRVGVREAVEPEAAQRPPLAPLGREGVGGRRRRHPCMEGRVEAGDRRDLRQQPRHGFERRERLRLVERRQIRKRVQPSHDGRVDRDRLDELRAAVDDPVADGVDRVAAPNDV